MYLIVAGGGKIGYYLTKTLVNEGYEVLLIEKDKKKVDIYTDRFGEVVVHGDACEASVLDAAGAGRANVVIAVTGDDEDNLVISQMAKRKFDVPRVIARVNNPKNEEIFRRLGINVTVSQTNVILSLIEQEIPERSFVHLLTLRHADLALVSATIAPDSPVVGETIGTLKLPPESVIGAVLREGRVLPPTSGTTLHDGDEVIILARREHEPTLRRLLT
jgi:trk system potassium uptake protein TrkA